MPFRVDHDTKEPFGYLIHHDECGLFCFVTDTCKLNIKFPPLNQILLECNFSDEILDNRTISGSINGQLRNRVINSHLSLEQCISVLKENDLSQVNKIILLHLSDGNSHAEQFIEKVVAEVGRKVIVADKNMRISFNKSGI